MNPSIWPPIGHWEALRFVVLQMEFRLGLKSETFATCGYHYNVNTILDGAVCIFIEGTALSAVGLVASKLGLIVVTLDRIGAESVIHDCLVRHPRTLLQDRPRHRPPEALSQLDDQSGRGPAVDWRNMYDTFSGDRYHASGKRTMPAIGFLAKCSHGICKLAHFSLLSIIS